MRTFDYRHLPQGLFGGEIGNANAKLFEDRRMAIREQVKQLEDTLAVLDFKCWYYETACKAGTEDVVRDLDNVKVPKKHARAREILDGKA